MLDRPTTTMTDAGPSKNRYELEDRGDYLYVGVIGTIESEAMMHAYHRDIEAAMKPHMHHRALFDTREATQAPPELRAAMWSWVSSTPVIQRAALVAHTERIQRRVERTADLNRVRLQSFGTIEEAEAWLRAGIVGPD